jgi:hypothetical protein
LEIKIIVSPGSMKAYAFHLFIPNSLTSLSIIATFMSNISTHAPPLQGWTNSPDSRGTLDVINSCIFTIFICVWSILCINITPPEESAIVEFFYKLKLVFLCVLGPDFLLLLAVGQFESARKSCEQFKSLHLSGWSMRHAFYADMGGFVVRTSDGVSWPLDANQLFHLIQQGTIQEAVLSSQILLKKSDITDRDKQSKLVRCFSVAQILWFLVSCLGRVCQRLPVTTLELTTIGFISTTIVVSIAWFHKPTDVKTQQVIELHASVLELHTNAGLSNAYCWYDTPLDFLDPEKSYAQVAWTYALNILLKIFMIKRTSERPITRRPDDNFPNVSRLGFWMIGIPGFFSWGANLAAWNFVFPTSVEKHMWRTCSIILCTTICMGAIYQEIIHQFFPDWRKKACDRFVTNHQLMANLESTTPEVKISEKFWRKKQRVILWLSNNSLNRDPSLTLELRVMFIGMFCGAMYALSWAYLLVDDLIGFRGQDPGVYETVNWGGFLPHV